LFASGATLAADAAAVVQRTAHDYARRSRVCVQPVTQQLLLLLLLLLLPLLLLLLLLLPLPLLLLLCIPPCIGQLVPKYVCGQDDGSSTRHSWLAARQA
jgi:hypothetical protein